MQRNDLCPTHWLAPVCSNYVAARSVEFRRGDRKVIGRLSHARLATSARRSAGAAPKAGYGRLCLVERTPGHRPVLGTVLLGMTPEPTAVTSTPWARGAAATFTSS